MFPKVKIVTIDYKIKMSESHCHFLDIMVGS